MCLDAFITFPWHKFRYHIVINNLRIKQSLIFWIMVCGYLVSEEYRASCSYTQWGTERPFRKRYMRVENSLYQQGQKIIQLYLTRKCVGYDFFWHFNLQQLSQILSRNWLPLLNTANYGRKSWGHTGFEIKAGYSLQPFEFYLKENTFLHIYFCI